MQEKCVFWIVFFLVQSRIRMRLLPAWQYVTVCYAYRVNHARGTESKQNPLGSAAWSLANLCFLRVNPSHKQLLHTVTQATGALAYRQRIWQVVCAFGYARRKKSAIHKQAAEKSRFCFYSVPIARIYREAQPTDKSLLYLQANYS